MEKEINNDADRLQRAKFYNDLSNYEIRFIARNLGIKNATTYNKPALINFVLDIEDNIIKPSMDTTCKKGRPPKASLCSLNKLYSIQNAVTLTEENVRLKNTIAKIKEILQNLEK